MKSEAIESYENDKLWIMRVNIPNEEKTEVPAKNKEEDGILNRRKIDNDDNSADLKVSAGLLLASNNKERISEIAQSHQKQEKIEAWISSFSMESVICDLCVEDYQVTLPIAHFSDLKLRTGLPIWIGISLIGGIKVPYVKERAIPKQEIDSEIANMLENL
jgi:hypothetical protein